ncbi:MAG TPA: DUF4168 domain-containing protein [Acidiphilium sp.]
MTLHSRTLPFAALAGLIATPFLTGIAMAQTSAASQSAQPPEVATPAQPITQGTITKAGHALRQVVAINKSYGNEAAKTSDSAEKQQLVAAAKQKAVGAITSQGLTVGQYNQVLASAQQNPGVRQQLLSAAGISEQK